MACPLAFAADIMIASQPLIGAKSRCLNYLPGFSSAFFTGRFVAFFGAAGAGETA